VNSYLASTESWINTSKMISKNMLSVNEFSSSLWEQIQKDTQLEIQKSPNKRRIAAFDADGTLWDQDAGETFFDWQIHNSHLANLPADPWEYYRSTKKVSPPEAYVWLARINSGQSLTQVRAWAKECFNQQPHWPVFESQRRLIQFLQKLDFEIFIVTASVKWAVEPVAALVGIDADHVLGVATKVIEGVVGTETVLPVTWRHGKAEALLNATNGVRPIFASGNTLGDISLLETATAVNLAIATQNPNREPFHNGLFEEELKLQEAVKQHSWTLHHFRP
jgi:phosphoserine phosphatase